MSCEEISAKLEGLWGIDLYPVADMPSYSSEGKVRLSAPIGGMFGASLLKGGVARATSLTHDAVALAMALLSFVGAVFVGYRKMEKRVMRTAVARLDHDCADYGSCSE